MVLGILKELWHRFDSTKTKWNEKKKNKRYSRCANGGYVFQFLSKEPQHFKDVNTRGC